MALFNALSAKVKANVIAQTELDSDAVFEYEPNIETVDKDPFATITYDSNENEFYTTSENRRRYSLLVRIYVERKNRGNAEAEQLLRDIMDDLLDIFDNDYTLTGSALTAKAAPSHWGYVFSTKEYRVAEIRLPIDTYFDLTP